MIANETAIHHSSNKENVSNYGQQEEKPIQIIGYRRPRLERYQTKIN